MQIAHTTAIIGSVFAATGATTAVSATGGPIAGDGPADAPLITDVLVSLSGDTSKYSDQFDVVCPFEGSTSPDAWYRFSYELPIVNLRVSACESSYDTKLYVLDGNLGPIACNDDACSDSNGNPFRSIVDFTVVPGQEYFIVVDGYGGEAGAYELLIEGEQYHPPCIFEPDVLCQDQAEDEPCGGPGSIDTVNGGCDVDEPSFTDAECGQEFCGTSWQGDGMRDTDWYRVAGDESIQLATMTASLIAEFDARLILFGVDADCGDTPLASDLRYRCEFIELDAEVPAGSEAWFVVVPVGWEDVRCDEVSGLGRDYIIDFSCVPSDCSLDGDIDDDGSVGFNDLLLLLSSFGDCPDPAEPCPDRGDLDRDGEVSFGDLVVLLSNWGPCP